MYLGHIGHIRHVGYICRTVQAHAADEWPVGPHIHQPQPKTTADRCDVARRRLAELGIYEIPALVDTANECFSRAYASWPLRWFFLEGNTITAVAQPRGGGGYDVKEIVSGLVARRLAIRQRT